MQYLKYSNEYYLETTNNFQTIRPFPDPAFPFAGNLLHMSELPSSNIAWHWHDEMEILYVKEGSLIITTTVTTHILNTGEAFFINSGIAHTLKTNQGTDCEFYSLRFLSRLLFSDKKSKLSTQYLLPMLMNNSFKQLPFTQETTSGKRILQYVHSIISICSTEEYGCELKILSNLYALWAELNTHLQQHSANIPLPTSVVSDHNRVISAIHYIANHYAEPLTLDNIAESIPLSKSECCRCFKRTIHLTPIEFLIQYRIMEAIRKMQLNDSTVASMALLASSVGFNSPSYFTKQFKKYIKCTPLEYQKKLLSNQAETSFEKEFKDILR